MKKVFLPAAFLTVLGMGIIACNKDQMVVNQIDGDWKVVKYVKDGVVAADSVLSGMEFTFDKCKQGDSDYCDGSVKISPFFFALKYRIEEKGEHMHMITQPGTVDADTTHFAILKHSKKELQLKSEGNSDVLEFNLEKK